MFYHRLSLELAVRNFNIQRLASVNFVDVSLKAIFLIYFQKTYIISVDLAPSWWQFDHFVIHSLHHP